jgi:dUTP pyrophosphatase
VLVNLDFDTPIHVSRGDKIAQLVVQKVEHVVVEVSEELSSSERGPGGFGSSGR